MKYQSIYLQLQDFLNNNIVSPDLLNVTGPSLNIVVRFFENNFALFQSAFTCGINIIDFKKSFILQMYERFKYTGLRLEQKTIPFL